MSLLRSYPVILFPEIAVESKSFTSRNISREKFISEINYLVPQTKKFNLYRLRLGIKVVSCLDYVISGIIFFSILRNVFQGDYYFLFLGVFILLFKAGIIWFLQQVLFRIESASIKDQVEAESIYWQKLKESNQDYLAQVEARTYSSNSLENNSQVAENSAKKLTYIRGVQQDNSIKGVSEKHFEKYLCKYFADCEISSDYFALNEKIGYSTDFSLLPSGKEVAIDIEIDEPYQGKTKQPHHCQDDNKDHRRNKYFLERGWIVVRFSEYQVAVYPDSCCLEIAKVLAKYNLSYYLEAFEDISELQLDQSWTKADAQTMARNRYRENYLEETGIFRQPSKRKRK